MATLKDIAKLAGVSYTTVSLVLNGKSKERSISQQTQEKVFAAAQQLQYVTNIAAKRLKTTKSNHYTIAVYWPADYRMSFISRLIDGMKKAIDEMSDPVDIIIRPYKNDFLCDDTELADGTSYHGAIISGASNADMEYLERTTFAIPIVVLNRTTSKYSTVGTNNYNAGRLAALHLISRGYTDITTVFTQNPFTAMHEHQISFLQTCQEHNCSIKNQFISKNSISGGFEIASEILKEPLPQVIFFDTDAIARGFLCAANMAGKNIPKDVSVLAMGVYSPESSSYTVPPLSTVDIPHELFAQYGLKLLIGSIKKELVQPCHLTFDAELKTRSSCQ